MQASKKPPRKPVSTSRGTYHNYSNAFKLKAVTLHLEAGIPKNIVAQEFNIASNTVYRWVKLYEESGESGLYRGYRKVTSQKKIPQSVTEKIIETKKNNPEYGVKRISNLLRRMFFLPGSHETVRKTLHENKLMSPPPKKKRQKNITRPRFFERSTPNQLWQTDIFTFRLGGKNAYLLGFIDDFSRYIVSLGCFRSQTAERVLEVYRRGCGEYNPPKEMLTDNGRQYTNWRGTTRFEKELQKDRVKHIRSQPHHPMTLGKIERFWKTIFQEYLSRAQFNSFEDAQERIQQWIKYYNHKRPHLGIGGLCPADRYFEVHTELRKTIEKGVSENTLELALRGQPRSPFYMVGRMEGQSVVLKAEKGKLRMTVDNSEESKELVYELNNADITMEETHGNRTEKEGEGLYGRCERDEERDQCNGEMPGRTINLVRVEEPLSGEPGVRRPMDRSEHLGETGDERHASSVGASPEKAGTIKESSPASGNTLREEYAEEHTEKETEQRYRINDRRRFTFGYGETGGSPQTSAGDNTGNERRDISHRGGGPSEHVPQELLQVGRTLYGEYGEFGRGPGSRQAIHRKRFGEGSAEEGSERAVRSDTGSSYGHTGAG